MLPSNDVFTSDGASLNCRFLEQFSNGFKLRYGLSNFLPNRVTLTKDKSIEKKLRKSILVSVVAVVLVLVVAYVVAVVLVVVVAHVVVLVLAVAHIVDDVVVVVIVSLFFNFLPPVSHLNLV